MPRPKKPPVPVHHKASGQVRVRIDGRDYYFGQWGDPEATAKANEFIAAHLRTGSIDAAEKAARSPAGISIAELVLAYLEHAEGHHQKNGVPTSELGIIKDTLRIPRTCFGSLPAAEFSPLKLKACRDVMVDRDWCRTSVNRRVGRIKRMFAWAVENELVPPSAYHGLLAVRGLQYGRSKAKETDPVKPVDTATVNATLPFLSSVVAAMVRFQAVTGCRPGEVCQLRPCDVDRDDPEVWIYRPASHKTQHHGRDRLIFIGPKGQRALLPFLDNRPADAPCFSPIEADAEVRAAKEARRKTPRSCGNWKGTNRKASPQRKPGMQYDRTSYRRAIEYAVNAANRAAKKADKDAAPIPAWTPNQLRHAAATAIRREFGLEGAQVALGHAAADVTQIYAERDADLARRVALAIG